MDNKYNLDFNEAMDELNDYVDVIEDNMNTIRDELKDNPEYLEVILNEMKNDTSTIDELEQKAAVHLLNEEYQLFMNQMILNDIYMMFIKEVLPGDDLSLLELYIESFSEDNVIEQMTKIIDTYLKC